MKAVAELICLTLSLFGIVRQEQSEAVIRGKSGGMTKILE
jgi:hypothetical protein